MSNGHTAQHVQDPLLAHAIRLTAASTASPMLKGRRQRATYKENRWLIVILWGITVLASIIGLSVPGLLGAAISLILAVIASMLGPSVLHSIKCMCEFE